MRSSYVISKHLMHIVECWVTECNDSPRLLMSDLRWNRVNVGRGNNLRQPLALLAGPGPGVFASSINWDQPTIQLYWAAAGARPLSNTSNIHQEKDQWLNCNQLNCSDLQRQLFYTSFIFIWIAWKTQQLHQMFCFVLIFNYYWRLTQNKTSACCFGFFKLSKMNQM